MAHTSKTPGRTQLINLFRLDDERRLVDLPGYGYAKVPLATKIRWEETVNKYLQNRKCLQGLVVVMDIRHPLKESDQHLLLWAAQCQVPVHILLTKSDKLKKAAARNTLNDVIDAIQEISSDFTVQIFSSLDRSGIEEAASRLDEWFEHAEV